MYITTAIPLVITDLQYHSGNYVEQMPTNDNVGSLRIDLASSTRASSLAVDGNVLCGGV